MTAGNSTPVNCVEYSEKCFDATSLSSRSSEIEIESEKDEKAPPIWRKFVGIALTIIASLFFTICAVIVKSISEISVSEMTTYRNVALLLLSFILVAESKENWFGESNWSWRFWMLVRSVSGTTNIFLFYLALKYIPLADATIFMLSVPVFVFIFARIFLKEPFGKWHVLAMFISTIGIVLASKVDFNSMFGKSNAATNETLTNATDPSDSQSESGLSNHLVGILLCITCIFTLSFVYIALRKVRTAHYSVVLFNFAIMGLIEMLIINSIWFQFRIPRQEYNAYWIMALGIFGFYGQFFFTKACQFEEAGVVSVVRASSDAVFAFVFQVAFFGEPLEMYSVAGAILVLASIFFLSFRKYVIALPDESALKKKLSFLA